MSRDRAFVAVIACTLAAAAATACSGSRAAASEPPGAGALAALGHAPVDGPLLLWGRPVPDWSPPALAAPSALDAPGGARVLAKLVSPEGELVVSRRELELRVGGGSALRYEGEARRVPAHWEEFPPLVQRVVFEPPLELLVMRTGRVEPARLAALDGVTFFTFSPPNAEEGVPMRFRPSVTLGTGGFAVLIAADAAEKARSWAARAKVATRTTRHPAGDAELVITATSLDLDGDGAAELIRYSRAQAGTGCDPAVDECGSPAHVLVARYAGRWHRVAEWRRGQDGFEGF